MAIAMPPTATSESPGYFASMRSPSFTSSHDTFTNARRFFSRALRQQHGRARLAHARGVAEPLRCRFTRRFRTHAARDVVTRPLLQVESKLVVDFLLGILVHRWPPVAGSSVEVTARLTALDSRNQPLACSSNSRSPALVSR